MSAYSSSDYKTVDDFIKDVYRLQLDPQNEQLQRNVRAGKTHFQNDPKYQQLLSRLAETRRSATALSSSSTSASSAEQQTTFQCRPIQFNRSLRFNQIAGLEREKKELYNAFLLPYRYPSLFPEKKAILLYSIPGAGKTFLMNHVAAEIQHLLARQLTGLTTTEASPTLVLYFSVSAADLKGIYTGQTEKNIRALFECAQNAAEMAQKQNLSAEQQQAVHIISIVFLDEIDAIGSTRRRTDAGAGGGGEGGAGGATLTSLLQEMSNEAYNRVKIVGATNRPWDLDSALLSRFPTKIFVDLPSDMNRLQILCNRINQFASTGNTICRDTNDYLACVLVPLTGLKTGAAQFLASETKIGNEKFWKTRNELQGRKEYDLKVDISKCGGGSGGSSAYLASPAVSSLFGYSNRDLTALADAIISAASFRVLTSKRKGRIVGNQIFCEERACTEEEMKNKNSGCIYSAECLGEEECKPCLFTDEQRRKLTITNIEPSDVLQALSTTSTSVNPTEYAQLVRYSMTLVS